MKKISICLCIALMFSNHAFSQIQVDSVGNVGVGTATPSAKLDVDGVIKATGGNSTDWNNKLDAEVDADTTNELQLLNLSGDTIFISNGNFIVIPNLNVLTTLNCSVSSSLSNTDETFSGAKDGSITVSSTCTGFCGTIQYSIIGGAVQTSNIFTGLAPGTYTIVATNDGIACSDTNMVTILAGPPPTVQQRLDTAETPLALFNTGIQLDSLYGKTYQGGLICYLDTLTGDGLIAALSDIPNSKRWHNGTGIVTGATDLSIGAGQSNTASIISVQGGGIYAATECTGFTSGIYTDWFLPSRAELNTMYVNLHSEGLGSFNPTLYWSSSEVNNSSAHTQDFFNGSFPSRLKGDNLRVRPCRAFSPVPPSCSISSSAGKTDETFSGFNDGSITVTASCTGSCGT
ncbi:MAG: DUF1566 domain-containing protein, partial [Bacteroidia bacterium]|nr:DUF1566 domain-containing protein [Bacteroidia bacterium]